MMRLSLILILLMGCGASGPVRIGMSPEKVRSILGSPDKRAVLQGKALRELRAQDDEEKRSRHRVVYVYDREKIRIWFKDGKVTGMTRDGIESR